MVLPWVCECGHRNPIFRSQCRVCGADRRFRHRPGRRGRTR